MKTPEEIEAEKAYLKMEDKLTAERFALERACISVANNETKAERDAVKAAEDAYDAAEWVLDDAASAHNLAWAKALAKAKLDLTKGPDIFHLNTEQNLMKTPEEIEALKAKFKTARNACVKAQMKVRDITGRQVTECNAKACDEYDAACEVYADAAIELALAVTYHQSTK